MRWPLRIHFAIDFAEGRVEVGFFPESEWMTVRRAVRGSRFEVGIFAEIGLDVVISVMRGARVEVGRFVEI